ncbi:hypothetical protein ACQEV9_07505 [Streptomyces chartreusis]|uniref:hypothetical protein n=1 Tax=Streptomyces chartreusis TaxID=1969 RepID=UPI003D8E51DB
MSEYQAGQDIRAIHGASAYSMVTGASRAYIRALAEHQGAALAGDADAARTIREAQALFTLACPELA